MKIWKHSRRYLGVLVALWTVLLLANLQLSSSAVVLFIAWTLVRTASDRTDGRFARRLALGMTAAFLGDLAMSGSVVPAAMLFFGIGHIFYIVAMLQLGRARHIGGIGIRAAVWPAFLVLGACIWQQVVLGGSGSSAAESPFLVWSAFFYTLLLASTAGVATGLAVRDRGYVWLALGAALFLASDTFIAMRMFNPEMFRSLPDMIQGRIVWLTYGPAQMLIVTSSVTSARS